jgi:hypothetical protein
MSGTTLYFGPGPGAAAWPLDVAAVEAALRARFPVVRFVRRTMPVGGPPSLRFEIEMTDGSTRKGVFGSDGMLSLSDGDAAIWAHTIAWYLTLLPPGTVTYAMVEQSLAGPTPMLVTSEPEIIDFLRDLEA